MWKTSAVSKQRFLVAVNFLVLLLLCSASPADFHKWVDEAGQVHYGDCPPVECESQTVDIPNPPSQEEVECAHQRLERYQQIIQKHRASREANLLQPASPARLIPDEIHCFDPINNLVIGPSSELYAPISPTILTKQQQKQLNKLFDKLDTHWRMGKVAISACKETSTNVVNESKYEDDEVSIEVDTISSENWMRIKLEWHDEIQNKRDRRLLNFKIGERLYFTGNPYFQEIGQPGNSVEILHLDRKSLLFLIKPRIKGAKGRIPYPELRYLVVSDKKWVLSELRYIQNRLGERRDWRFRKSIN